eukprot:6732466-Prymnesium_polylepis.1
MATKSEMYVCRTSGGISTSGLVSAVASTTSSSECFGRSCPLARHVSDTRSPPASSEQCSCGLE